MVFGRDAFYILQVHFVILGAIGFSKLVIFYVWEGNVTVGVAVLIF